MKMKTKLWAIILMLITTFLTSTAQLFYKAGAATLEFDIVALITNQYLIIGLVLYMIGAVLMITAFRGGELSVLYPIIATSYIWVGLFAYFLFGEALNPIRWMGIAAIFFGVVLVGIGSRDKEVISEAGASL